MNQEYLEFMASYLDKIDDAQNIDIEKIGYDRYAENLFDIIIEISNIFEKELPEIKTSVLLRNEFIEP